MNSDQSSEGRVASLHLHPIESGAPLTSVSFIEVVESKGIVGEPRYFGRLSRDNGQPSRRQITLMEREQIADHATALNLQSIPPGAVRANIETQGVNLVALIGQQVQIGEATVFFYEARTGCAQMDAVCKGLRALTADRRLGVLAEIVRSGRVSVGDAIRPVKSH